MITMRRRIAGLKTSEIRSLGREELDVPVTMEAVKKCNKNVSSEDLEKYKVEMGFRVPSRVKKREVEYFVINMNIIYNNALC